MASYVFYPGDGVQTDWTVPFPYLSKSHVKVLVDGTAVTFSWLNTSLIRVTPAVANGKVLLVKRETQTAPMAQFENTNNLTAENLTLAETQALFLSQEARDRSEQSIVIDDATGQYSFGNRRATNVADPINPQDAATKKWAETSMTSQLSQAISAQTSATASAASASIDRGVVASDRATVATDKGIVAADKATVAADKATVSGWKDIIFGWMNTISGWKDTIEGWKNSTSTWKDQASASATGAATSKSGADSARDTAVTKASEASASAAAAAASAASVDGANLLHKSDIAPTADILSNTGSGVITTDKAWDAAKWVDKGDATGALVINADDGVRQVFTLTGNVVVSVTNAKSAIEVAFVQDATGNRTIGWDTNIKFPNDTVPAITVTAGSTALIAVVEPHPDPSLLIANGWHL